MGTRIITLAIVLAANVPLAWGQAPDMTASLVTNINPLENLKGLSPLTGGIQFTIKDGIVYNTPRLFEEVRKIVTSAKSLDKGRVSGQ